MESPVLVWPHCAEHPQVDAVLSVTTSPVGAHVGILYRADDDGTLRQMHMAWHNRMLSSAPWQECNSGWVQPRLDELALADLATSARLIARCQENGRVPYALDVADARYDDDGHLCLGKSLGLTCATFVLLICDHARTTIESHRSSFT